jgi:hypothetical protein
MSKLLKRISSVAPEREAAVVVGENFPELTDIFEAYGSVFLYETQTPTVKGRNVIPRLNFTEVKTLPRFDLLIVDEKYLLEIGNFVGIAARYQAGIVLKYQELPSKKIARHLAEHNYTLIDSAKDLHFWKKTKI